MVHLRPGTGRGFRPAPWSTATRRACRTAAGTTARPVGPRHARHGTACRLVTARKGRSPPVWRTGATVRSRALKDGSRTTGSGAPGPYLSPCPQHLPRLRTRLGREADMSSDQVAPATGRLVPAGAIPAEARAARRGADGDLTLAGLLDVLDRADDTADRRRARPRRGTATRPAGRGVALRPVPPLRAFQPQPAV